MTTRFPTATVSDGDAVGQVEDLAQQAGSAAYNEIAAATATLTAAQVVNGILNITSGTTSSLTFPTAALLVAALKQAQAGSSFNFWLINGGSGTATVNAGSGNTLKGGTASPTTGKAQIYKGVVTNAGSGTEAVTIVAISSLI